MGDYGNYDLDKIYTTQEFPLGAKVEDQCGRVFKFVKYNDGDNDVVGVAGYLAVGLDSAYPAHEVTCDFASATVPAMTATESGFLQAALTNGTFGFVQTWGPSRKAMLTDENVDQGERLMRHSTNGAVIQHDNTAAKVVAIALEADAVAVQAVGTAFITIETK